MDQDDARAYELFRQASQLGNVAAMHNLGFLLAKGRGTVQSLRSAASIYKKAANLNFAPAMVDYAIMVQVCACGALDRMTDACMLWLCAPPAADNGLGGPWYGEGRRIGCVLVQKGRGPQ